MVVTPTTPAEPPPAGPTPEAAAQADRTVLLADGQVTETLEKPSAEHLAARMIEVKG